MIAAGGVGQAFRRRQTGSLPTGSSELEFRSLWEQRASLSPLPNGAERASKMSASSHHLFRPLDVGGNNAARGPYLVQCRRYLAVRAEDLRPGRFVHRRRAGTGQGCGVRVSAAVRAGTGHESQDWVAAGR